MTDREFYITNHICPICRKESIVGIERTCPECLAKYSEYNRKYYSKYGRVNKTAHNTNRRLAYCKRIESGICTKCGKHKPASGKKKCIICLDKDRLASMRYRTKIKLSEV